MPSRFVWITESQPVAEGLQGEPRPWPQEVLDRHGLRQLKPAEATRIPSDNGPGTQPRSTVYRAATLLIPERLFRKESAALDMVRQVLRTNGNVELTPPAPLSEVEEAQPYLDTLAGLPRPAVLHTADGSPPDAWTSLQALRRAVVAREFERLPQDDRDDVDRISLEHALSGCVIIGPAPASEPHPGTGDEEPAAVRSGYGRRPVMYVGAPPCRPKPKTGTRRPVIAVVDTGYGAHEWFGTSGGQALSTDPDHFLKVSPITQKLIQAQLTHVQGLTVSDVLDSDREGPVYADPITQQLSTGIGHGTFIAGLIHQAAPGADVLSIRALRADDVAYEADVLIALYVLLAKQKDRTNPSGWVDVISLSLGYYREDHEQARTTRIGEVLELLTAHGVLVVAAAGNDTTSRPFMPAALAAVPADKWTGERVIGVGALNTNGTVAWFSNTGESVSVYAPGSNLISTFPDDVRGSNRPVVGRLPDNAEPRIAREGFDSDDFVSGFASWSGTSFATPVVAAEIANQLFKPAPEAEQPEEVEKAEVPVPDMARAKAVVAALRQSANPGKPS
ncbi:S8 family peptidase [Lentzea sp. NPDC102401]|uniref:S8 family peptidase n=1 Tax=Lentzea sp. NPDC102401 TaxID=3364128 RepID=UPI0038150E6F